jgi:peptide chain release factor
LERIRAFDSQNWIRFAQKKDHKVDLPTQIERRLGQLGVRTNDVRERFVLGKGPGGQKINKTSSTVWLRHSPTGTEVRCQGSRSREANRQRAWESLCEKMETERNRARAQARQEREKAKRRTRPKSRGQKRRMLADKRHRSGIKSTRGRVSPD